MDFVSSVCAYLDERGLVYECRDGAVFVVFKAARFALPFMFFDRDGWSAYCELPFTVDEESHADFAAAVQACNSALSFGAFTFTPARGLCEYRATIATQDAPALIDNAYHSVAANIEKLFSRA